MSPEVAPHFVMSSASLDLFGPEYARDRVGIITRLVSMNLTGHHPSCTSCLVSSHIECFICSTCQHMFCWLAASGCGCTYSVLVWRTPAWSCLLLQVVFVQCCYALWHSGCTSSISFADHLSVTAATQSEAGSEVLCFGCSLGVYICAALYPAIGDLRLPA